MKILQQILLLLCISSLSISAQNSCSQNTNHPNYQSITQSVNGQSITREYILYVPENLDGNSSVPLVINMHGFGDCASNYADAIGNFYEFNDLAQEESFIVAYPQGAYRPEKEDHYWEPGDSGLDNIYENDVFFLDELITKIDSEYNIDMNQVYACGYSNGGMMAYSLACNRSTTYAAIGIMSGTMLEEDCEIEEAVPIIIFHGIEDEVLPYNGNLWYQSVQEVVEFWLDQNDLSTSDISSFTLSSGKVDLDEYSNGISNGCISLYTINEEFDKPGGHVWFSEEIEGSSPNRILWDFFTGSCSLTNIELEEYFDVKIGPNPITNHIIIDLQVNRNLDYLILDSHGVLVKSGELNNESNMVSTSEMPSGNYFLKINNQAYHLIKF